jgi:putative membrane protein
MLLTFLLNLARGFAMGSADIVPGVSGGTVALVLGIYERLIASIRAGSRALGLLLRGDRRGFRAWMSAVDWLLIIPLGSGILLAVLALARIIQQFLEEQPELMAAVFLGLVAGSVVVAWRLIRVPRASHAVIIAAVGLLTFVLLGLRDGTTEDTVAQASDVEPWAFFVAGAIAICAMILPGISGSFLLVLLGMYGAVLAAVTERDFLTLGVFVAGAVIGLALFSQLLHVALRRYHDIVLAMLIGLMAGSIRVLWPWPDGVESTVLGAPRGEVFVAAFAAVVAFVVVVIIARYAQAFEATQPHPDAEPPPSAEPATP